MKDIVREYQEQFRRHRLQLRRYTALLLALAMVTTLFVNWQLHSDGIAKTAEYLCGQEEHEHTADCYPQVLVCGYEEGESEDWTISQPEDDSLFDAGFGVDAEDDYGIALYSEQAEAEPEYIFVPHEHTEDCYQEVTVEVPVLTCVEEEHEHTDECYDPEANSLIGDQFEHTHDDSCYTIEYETEEELVCGYEEGELVEELNPDYNPVAMFQAPVYNAMPVVVSPVEEGPVHHHTDACYAPDYTADPICGLEEHHHDVNCLSDPMDSVEDEADWLAQTDTTLTGVWTDDLLTVAKSQLGYEQSEKNFQLDTDDGETLRYYTRYGQWYGNKYGPWDVMFLSYCLNYADIPESAIPHASGALSLHSSLRGSSFMGDVGTDLTSDEVLDAVVPGDIVFYTTTTKVVVAVDDSQPSDSTVDSTGISDASGDAGIALLSLDEGFAVDAEPQTEDPTAAAPQTEETTVTDTTVGIVSAVDEAAGTLTVISGNVDGKVAEVTLYPSQVTTLVSVATAQALSEEGADTLESSDITGLNGAQYVTNFEIQKKNKNGAYESATEVTISDEVRGRIDLSNIPAQSILDNNYKVYVTLPSGIDCTNIQGSTLKDSDGNDTGSFSFEQVNGNWVLVLTYDKDFIEKESVGSSSTVSSWVNFNFNWDEEKITQNGENSFKINDSHTVTITINKKEETETDAFSLKKSSANLRYDDNKNAYIDYTVELKVKKEMTAPLTLEDVLTNPGSASFQYDGTPSITAPDNVEAPSISWSDSTTGKTITVGQEGQALQPGTYKITYSVKCANFNSTSFTSNDKVKNTISSKYDEESHDSSSSTKLNNKLVDKSGKWKSGEIEWTVKLNQPGDDGALAYLPADTTFTDALPAGLELVDNKIKVKMDNGDFKTITLTDEQYQDGKITYKLTEGYHSYTITYKTTAPENTGVTDITVTNEGHLDGTGISDSDTGTVTIKSDVLSKELEKGTNTDGTATMNWKTTIHATDLSSYVYYDWSGTFSLNGVTFKAQELVPDSVKVVDAKGDDVTNRVRIDEKYSYSPNNVDVGLFSIDFKNSGITGPVTITYQTTANTAQLNPGSRYQIVNYGKLNDGKTVSAQYDFTNTSDQWKYFYKYGGNYNYDNVMANKGSISLKPGDVLPWTIAINDKSEKDGGLEAKNYSQWVVTDTIPKGLVLDESSICVYQYSTDNLATYGTDYTYTVDYQDDCTVLTVTLYGSYIMLKDQTPRQQVRLTYNTSLDSSVDGLKDSETLSFTNHATLTCDDVKKGDTHFTEEVKVEVVGKQGSFDENTGTLTYNVMVNPYGLQLLEEPNGQLLLTDILNLPNALKGNKDTQTKYVWLEDISVYKGEFQNGEFVPTQWIGDLTAITGDYDTSAFENSSTSPVGTETYYAKDNATFSQITVWTKVPDSTPLVLVFHYTVDCKGLASNTTLSFKNSVMLNNNSKWSIEDTSLKPTYNSSGGNTINYNQDRLSIYKYTGNLNNPLSGAKFALKYYDTDTNTWITAKSYTTNGNGNILLNVDRYRLYCVTETEAPLGYLLPANTSYYFYIGTDTGDYTPPEDSGISADDVHIYRVTDTNTFQTFYYNVENAANPDYVEKGSLKVTKAWNDSAGTSITDKTILNTLPEIQVNLTKHSETATVTFVGTDKSSYSCKVRHGQSVKVGWTTSGSFTLSADSVGKAKILDNATVYSDQSVYIQNITADVTVNVNSGLNSDWFQPTAVGEYDGQKFTSSVGTATLSKNTNWTYTWSDLDADDGVTYTLEEIHVDGYTTHYQVNGTDIAEDAVPTITLDANAGSSVKITNTAESSGGYELPSTGGAGTTPYTAGGIALMLAALVCVVCQKRRRERRAHD